MPTRNAGRSVFSLGVFRSKHTRTVRRSSLSRRCPDWLVKESYSRLRVVLLISKRFRRFEILLPLRFNDGRPVPDELIAETLLELRVQFGAVLCETQTIRGSWLFDAEVFRDDLIRVYVDTDDVQESREFFVQYKDKLKARFEQLDIWMTTYPIEIL